MCATSRPFEVRFHAFLVVLLTTRKVHWRTMDDMNITPFSSSRPQRLFEAIAWSESTIGLLTVQSQCVEGRVKTPPTPPFCKQQRHLQRNNIFSKATSSRFQQVSIQRSPHDVITPPPPPHPPSLYHNNVYST